MQWSQLINESNYYHSNGLIWHHHLSWFPLLPFWACSLKEYKFIVFPRRHPSCSQEPLKPYVFQLTQAAILSVRTHQRSTCSWNWTYEPHLSTTSTDNLSWVQSPNTQVLLKGESICYGLRLGYWWWEIRVLLIYYMSVMFSRIY